MKIRDQPTLHIYKNKIKEHASIAVLHFTVTVGSSIMNITHT